MFNEPEIQKDSIISFESIKKYARQIKDLDELLDLRLNFEVQKFKKRLIKKLNTALDNAAEKILEDYKQIPSIHDEGDNKEKLQKLEHIIKKLKLSIKEFDKKLKIHCSLKMQQAKKHLEIQLKEAKANYIQFSENYAKSIENYDCYKFLFTTRYKTALDHMRRLKLIVEKDNLSVLDRIEFPWLKIGIDHLMRQVDRSLDDNNLMTLYGPFETASHFLHFIPEEYKFLFLLEANTPFPINPAQKFEELRRLHKDYQEILLHKNNRQSRTLLNKFTDYAYNISVNDMKKIYEELKYIDEMLSSEDRWYWNFSFQETINIRKALIDKLNKVLKSREKQLDKSGEDGISYVLGFSRRNAIPDELYIESLNQNIKDIDTMLTISPSLSLKSLKKDLERILQEYKKDK